MKESRNILEDGNTEINDTLFGNKKKVFIFVVIALLLFGIFKYAPVMHDAYILAKEVDLNRLSYDSYIELSDDYFKRKETEDLLKFIKAEGYTENELYNINLCGNKDESRRTVCVYSDDTYNNRPVYMVIDKYNSAIDCSDFMDGDHYSDNVVTFKTLSEKLGLDLSYYEKYAPKGIANQNAIGYFIILSSMKHKNDVYEKSLDGIDITLNINNDEEENEYYISLNIESNEPEKALNSLKKQFSKFLFPDSASNALANISTEGVVSVSASIEPYPYYFETPTNFEDEEIIDIIKNKLD